MTAEKPEERVEEKPEAAQEPKAPAESLPAECGGGLIVLAGLTADGLAELPNNEALGLEPAQGITWTNQSVSFFGELVDGEFVIDPLIAG